jgi:acetylglutamate kinase
MNILIFLKYIYYVNEMMGETIAKMSGFVLDNGNILENIAPIKKVTVVYGGGKQISNAGIQDTYDKDGRRIVSKEDMKECNIPRITREIGENIVNALNTYLGYDKFRLITTPVFAEKLSEDNYAGIIEAVIRKHNYKNAVVGFLGETTTGELVDVNADEVAAAIGSLGYKNIIYITKDKNSKGMELKKEIAKTLDIKIMDEKGFLEWCENG